MDTQNIPPSRHFQLIHALKRRIRLVSPALAKDFERTYLFAILLRRHQGIHEVHTVPEIGSVVVWFDPKRLNLADLLKLLDTLIGNLGQQSSNQSSYALRAMADAGQPVLDFHLAIEGMTCASCALLIEVRLRRDPRISQASVNFATETATVRGGLTKEDLFAQIRGMGYRPLAVDTLTQRKLLTAREGERLAYAKKRAVWSNLLNLPGILIALAGPHSRWLHWFEFGTTVPIALWAGWPLFNKAWALFSQHRSANMDTLVALGVGLAYSQGLFTLIARRRAQYFQAATAVISFVLLNRYLEERARGRAHAAMRRLIDGQPQTATVLLDGRELSVGIDAIQAGDWLLVRPGERIPCDGLVVDGLSTVDESLVTGESLAVVKEAGAKLVGGCVNGAGALRMRATAVGADTVLAGIIQNVDLAQGDKLPVQHRVDRVSSVFMPSVLGLGGLTFAGWLAVGATPSVAMTHAIALLLAACPCALGTATPAAIMVGTGEAARRGIYIRNGASLETVSQLTVMVFDKTGTLTEGRASVVDCVNLPGETGERVLSLAASAEFASEHYLGRALVAKAKEAGLPLLAAENFAYRPGKGIYASVDGVGVLVGSRSWLEESGVDARPLLEQADAMAGCGQTPVFIALDGRPAALFGLSDPLRPNARQAIERLHRLGVKTLMLTGDAQATAEHIARQAGIDAVIAHAGPERKLEVICELRRQGGRVGMVGDGINDAPALAAADVSFAIVGGADLALQTADISLARGDIGKLAEAMALSEATLRVVRQNLGWAFGYNSLAIPLAAFGALSPMTASIAMSISSLSMVLNALRLQRRGA